ncbi:MAG: GlsB/YeaQ/YmgE family stress response membrane protein [Acidimicrobiales bacterium]
MAWIIGIIGSIIAGGIIGFIARAIMPGKQDMSIPMTVGLGIAGMVIGNIVGRIIPPDNEGVPWILGTVFAVVILFVLSRTGNLSKVTKSA